MDGGVLKVVDDGEAIDTPNANTAVKEILYYQITV